MRQQQGQALVLALIVLATGALLLGPSLSYTQTALRSYGISRTAMWTGYAMDGTLEEALWKLQYDPGFADQVAASGSVEWTNTLNDQTVTVSVEVPGALTAPPEPTPTPTSGSCFYASVSRDPTWVQVDEPITYTLNIWNCGDKNIALRRIKALLSSSFSYVPGSTSMDSLYSPPPSDLTPEENICDGVAPDYYPCPQSSPPITDGTLMLNWPDGTTNYSGGDEIRLREGQDMTWTFQATPSGWGVFYIDVVLCYYSSASGDPGPCGGDEGTTKRSGKVAPVIVGLFNIKVRGKGHGVNASSGKGYGVTTLLSLQNQ